MALHSILVLRSSVVIKAGQNGASDCIHPASALKILKRTLIIT